MVSKKYDKIPYTPRQEKILRDFFAQDFIIYEHFNASLWRQIDSYGRSRMAHDVKKVGIYLKYA